MATSSGEIGSGSRSFRSFDSVDSTPKKALFKSPTALDEEQMIDPLLDKLQVEHDTEACLKNTQKELHEQRLEELRKKLKWLEDTNWKYAPAEKLIGLE
ncbi:uncharacterized protein [Amphiura filiformis]|uniref:uncharacterized protein n=1 Tax=Amphiura filiformis TaxID=82378 RepID=UPI003B2217CE